jgi:hypothetical protein
MYPYLAWQQRRAVALLSGERNEEFEFERAISLLEFQTWIYSPGTNLANIAGLMAAVLILENIEDDIYADEPKLPLADPDEPTSINLNDKPDATLHRISVLRANKTYKGVHDRIFALRGSLKSLLYCPSPDNFDADVAKRRTRAQSAADLIDYRLRYAQHGAANGQNHPTRRIF